MDGYGMAGGFRSPDELDREIVLKSEKKVLNLRIVAIVIFLAVGCFSYWMVFVRAKLAMQEYETIQKESGYLLGFNQTEDSIIRELYGDANEYAESQLYKNKKNFLDKAATAATGKMTYDEAAMENYRQTMIAEFNSRIDHDKVADILAQRKASYSEAKIEEETEVKNSHKNPVRDLLVFGGMGLLAFLVYLSVFRRYQLVKKGDYELVEGTVISKDFLTRRDVVIGLKRLASVSYRNGVGDAQLTHPQGFSIAEGDRVYLIHLNTTFKPNIVCKI
ncbi:MAG: hypothetical protein MJ131_07990 [Lachnospiraceae bacterium]|nr:hypothetical protein [Lachnospiraceae bacterium]